jgi:hypothetical protein
MRVGTQKMPEDRKALLLRLRPKLKEQLVDLAKREHRSLNQQMEFILEDFLLRHDTSEHAPENRRSGGGRAR